VVSPFIVFAAPLLWLLGGLVGVAGLLDTASVLFAAGAVASFTPLLYSLLGSRMVYSASIPFILGVPGGIHVRLGFNMLGAVFAAAIGLSGIVGASMQPWYRRLTGHGWRGYMGFYGVALASMYMVVAARDVFSLVASWEAMTLSLGVLIGYGEDGGWAAKLYLILLHAVSAPMLAAAAWMLAGGHYWYSSLTGAARGVVEACFLTAFIAKSGLAPFHVWLPPCHSRAPSDASVVLSGASVKPPLFQALLLLSSAGFNTLLVGVAAASAAASILVGCLGALWAREGKRVLAYTTIAYMGSAWLLMICSLYVPQLLAALAALVVMHAAYKSVGFLAAGAAKAVWRGDRLSEAGGLCWDGGPCGVGVAAAASMLPVPGLARFVGELAILYTLLYAAGLGFRWVLLLLAVLAIQAVAVSIAYGRLLSMILQPLSPEGPVAMEGYGVALAAAWFTALAAPLLISSFMGSPWIVLLVAVLGAGAAAGLAWRGGRAAPWLAGFAAAAASGAQPLSLPAPRRGIEERLSRLRRPWIRERDYTGLYHRFARAVGRYVVEPFNAPRRSGALSAYILCMLVYFLLVIIASWRW